MKGYLDLENKYEHGTIYILGVVCFFTGLTIHVIRYLFLANNVFYFLVGAHNNYIIINPTTFLLMDI